ncbi:MAG: hypothetical protein K8R36_06205, partial [Planctomycetales bacterium]|nr:hypothetical protein [Planctomycetales bacterium]
MNRLYYLTLLVGAIVGVRWGMCDEQESGAKSLILLPAHVSLSTKESRQTLVPQWKRGEQVFGQAAEGLQLSSSDEKIVKIE